MDRIEALSSSILRISSSIRSTMLLHIGAMIAAIFALVLSHDQINAAIDSRDQLQSLITKIDDDLSEIEKTWHYDSTVLLTIDAAYIDESLSNAAKLLFLETMFFSYLTILAEEDTEADESIRKEKIEKSNVGGERVGQLSQRINKLRQSLITLNVPASQGLIFEEFSRRQTQSYSEYLEFHEYFESEGAGSKEWTFVCVVAFLIDGVFKDVEEPKNKLDKLFMSEESQNVLTWAIDQLQVTDSNKSELISNIESVSINDVDASFLELLEMADDSAQFTTPRDSTLLATQGLIDQTRAASTSVSSLLDELVSLEYSTLSEARLELNRRINSVTDMESKRSIPMPFLSINVPMSFAWILIPFSAAFTFTLFKLRNRIERDSQELRPLADTWKTVHDVMPYRYTTEYKPSYWIWQSHHDTLGLFGLTIAAVSIWSYPSRLGISGWAWSCLAYIILLFFTVFYWTRYCSEADDSKPYVSASESMSDFESVSSHEPLFIRTLGTLYKRFYYLRDKHLTRI